MPLTTISDQPLGNSAAGFSPVNILMYHDVELHPRGPEYNHFYVLASEFEWQMRQLLGAGYRPVTLAQVGDAISGLSIASLPEKSFVVTFDDGYRNLLQFVYPLMMELSIPYTVFPVTDRIGECSEWVVPEGLNPSPLLTWQELDSMRQWSGVSVQSHTCTHVRLETLTDKDAEIEMRRCKDVLQQRFGAEVDHICYPYGSVNARIADLAEEIGYKLGVTTEFGRARAEDKPLLLPRVSIYHVPSLSWKYGIRPANFWWRIRLRRDRRPLTVSSDCLSR
jgi:peptidoglycan/xylan/chitin deacetylase (PgdA/CDA1 family)